MLLVEEAGGRVTGYRNEPIDLFGKRIVASNGWMHAAILQVINDVYEERPPALDR